MPSEPKTRPVIARPGPHLLSASRRTDIPAFYMDWFVNRLEAGSLLTMNPFGGQIYRIDLSREAVRGIVFWTRAPRGLLRHFDRVVRFSEALYCHFTITGLSRPFETHNPALASQIAMFRALSDRLSPERLTWRFDPILLSCRTGPAETIDRFTQIARELAPYTGKCVTSFVDRYGKTRRGLDRLERTAGVRVDEPSLDERRALVTDLASRADDFGLELELCTEPELEGLGLSASGCIGQQVAELLDPDRAYDSQPTRTGCTCVRAVDIGAYDSCPFGCVYCYATNSRGVAQKRLAAHDPESAWLWQPQSLHPHRA